MSFDDAYSDEGEAMAKMKPITLQIEGIRELTKALNETTEATSKFGERLVVLEGKVKVIEEGLRMVRQFQPFIEP